MSVHKQQPFAWIFVVLDSLHAWNRGSKIANYSSLTPFGTRAETLLALGAEHLGSRWPC
jgi:hypothetical protein